MVRSGSKNQVRDSERGSRGRFMERVNCYSHMEQQGNYFSVNKGPLDVDSTADTTIAAQRNVADSY